MENRKKRIILGIDPGSRCTGYGIIWADGNRQGVVTHGFIACRQEALSERLYQIYQHLHELIIEYQPQEVAIEQVFTCLNPQSALKLGQARGAALTASAAFSLPVQEYSARQIKKAVVGYGAANKMQIQHMVRALFQLTETPQTDAADALAIAFCHATHQLYQSKVIQGKPS